MNLSQREHIANVVASVEQATTAQVLNPQGSDAVQASWLRCVNHHGLDPSRLQEARILPAGQLREHRQQLEELRFVAQPGLDKLYQQIAPAGYILLLADAQGVAVDYLGDVNAEISLRRAGLFLGAQWSEALSGTCAVGTALATRQAITIHQTDHFDATHIPLTCSAVPLFDSQGDLQAVLDISALTSPQPRTSQHLVMQLAQQQAQKIENAWLLHRHRHDWVLKLSRNPAWHDIEPEFLLAFDAHGRLTGLNPAARHWLKAHPQPLGLPLSALFPGPMEQLLYTPQLEDISGQQRFYAQTIHPVRPTPATGVTLSPKLAALSGGDPQLDQQLRRATRLLDSSLHVLVQGETGSGKEYFARAFHQASPRCKGPFVAVNCAAIPASLLESELFGHLPGSFSGAGSKARRGLIQAAEGGTLFLDEIGDMPLEMQTRLLRVLSEQEVTPIGARQPQKVDIRVLSASHHPLAQRVADGLFREDLLYRLQGACVHLPPLRERKDINWLIEQMLAGRAQLSDRARQALVNYRWPGNLRELNHALQYALAMCESGVIEWDDLPDTLCFVAPFQPPASDDQHEALLRQLRTVHWNISAAARQLGISRMTLYRRLQRLGIQLPERQ
ncbi:sigma-54-dependent Fis family transcriptional regulator [Pantoea phytobeneficialis]|uniref:Sigma-54-dependent Fis family transcriptional regulator n=1 Tax=Pantoea phytobeneficialis TaxID=2052056 RepID=A0AAP9H8Y3_9GAMM|nr:sigma-54-dependent Fis family transcriptional regulator [Pantoea phytobeneficialis]MDO6408725.1 sigma-54-dependent Fis family transcriptional regulator [Pantoea phytobeneficialis]QGR08975.1 sigma-54-dependent Fis family transcriptional regulator [Pantoea phytobeneficialis]